MRKCADCGYWFNDRCIYDGPEDWAPCAQDEYDETYEEYKEDEQ